MVDLKSKFWLYLSIDALIVIIAIISPAITAHFTYGIAFVWMWGSSIAPASVVVVIPEYIFLTGIIFLILNIISVVILIFTALMSRKDIKNRKILQGLLLICGIILIVGSLMYMNIIENSIGVSWGYHKFNFGSIGPIIAGILSFIGVWLSRKI